MYFSKGSVLLIVICCQLELPCLGRRLPNNFDYLQRLLFQQLAVVGSCVSRGFDGCCPPGNPKCCLPSAGSKGYCYCDQACYVFKDCCTDIRAINCLPEGETTTTTTVAPTTMEMTTPAPTTTPTPTEATNLCAMKINGTDQCCNQTATDCQIKTKATKSGYCNCDRNCYIHGDCCPGLEENGCYARNCSEAGIPVCCNSSATNCKVITSSNTSCFCDSNCHSKNGNNPECCSDMPESCPNSQQINAMLEKVEDLLEVMQARLSRDRMAAAFWRRYSLMNRKQRVQKNRIKNM